MNCISELPLSIIVLEYRYKKINLLMKNTGHFLTSEYREMCSWAAKPVF
jgi:hypothetical protein